VRHAALLGPAGMLACIATAAACSHPSIDEIDEVFHRGPRRVLCAAGLDDSAGNDLDSVLSGLERAAERKEILSLYAHRPGGTVPVETIRKVVEEAVRYDLATVSYAQLAVGLPTGTRGGVSLSFDDAHVDEWFDMREMLAYYGANVTFFVSRFDRLSDEQRDKLHQLADDGHSIEAHGLRHQNAPAYVEEHGHDALMVSEHHAADDGYLPSPLLVASAFAAVTSRIPISVSALLVNLYETPRLAEDIAVLDYLSKGRVSYTMGLGYREEEYALYGRDWRTRGRDIERRIEELLRIWKSGEVTPAPYSKPHP